MAPRKPKPTGPTPVEATIHVDTRANIPTSQLAHMVDDVETAPAKVRYKRDPSLDPQLVWRGKDEQDSADLEIPAVPIYIQEKIDPRAIIENLRDTAATGEPEPELTLFADWTGLDTLEQLEFYEHADNWQNRMILGDSLLVMTSLSEKEDLRGKVQIIYIDPPYGIKFGSNWQVSTKRRDVKDGKADDATRQPEQVKAFRDTWELGIHSYLGYLRDRLVTARDLLNESGSVFVQIGDENVHRVRSVLDEVFGDSNFCSQIAFKTTSGAGSFAGGTNVLAAVSNYLLWYAKDAANVKYRQLYRDREMGGAGAGQYSWIEEPNGVRRRGRPEEMLVDDPASRVLRPAPLTSQTTREAQTTVFPVTVEGRSYVPAKGGWKTNRQGMDRLLHANRLMGVGNTLTYIRYFDDFPAFPIHNIWDDTVTSGFADPKVYVVQTNSRVVERCMLMTTDPGDLVLDPTCGSGTTAYVAEQWGRRWITTDTSRVALALARTRLMAARYPAYLLADSAEGAAKEQDLTAVPAPRRPYGLDIRQGFVCKRVPHVTLKSIAQNPDIKEGMSGDEIDRAIARHADVEVLVDQPYVDTKKVRVSGRFTVESLSPHRMLEDDRDAADAVARAADPEAVQFETMILENLRKAGVQNGAKQERIRFERLEPYAGTWLHADGEYIDGDGNAKRVAVSIGPQFGTVGAVQIGEAGIEAQRGLPFDLLIVAGFAFDPDAWTKASEFAPDLAERKVGKIRVLLARANPDLFMADELLKKTGAGNLFTVFGEPDVDVRPTGDGQWVVEIHGVDVYDPTRGEVRSSKGTDDVACWFIDTDYDNKSFFVRHAYFTGGNEPYESLRKALRADIDEAAWTTLYSTVSRAFSPPRSGQIAVKVIDHYGDEIIQVYNVPPKVA